MKIAFIPIDNRPVCYTLAQQIANIDSDIELYLPPRELLGDLKKSANIAEIFNWLKTLPHIDKAIVSLDTIAYGGLIPSRRSLDTFDEVKQRVDNFLQILASKNAKVFAFSSIMRISNNNVNEEEKEYWSEYGKKIFEYSFESHKNAPEECSLNGIPEDIIQDYLATRRRNFEINKYYLKLLSSETSVFGNLFETLVFSKDDCAQYGFNVAEAQAIQDIIENTGVNAFVKTGADEIPLSLLGRALVEEKSMKICPIFTNPEFIDRISKYEDISVFESVKGQIELVGGKISSKDDSDIVLLVNNFREEQGELVMGVDVQGYDNDFDLPQKPYLVVDILNANGADNLFVQNLLKKDIDWQKFLGFAAWNTTGNTLGSALCCAVVKYFAKEKNEEAFKYVQMVRLLDDWAYQANVRKKLKSYLSEVSISELTREMKSYESIISEFLKMDIPNVAYSYPWNRFFEIEVN